MRVNNIDDRLETPKECDKCDGKADLERFYYYGPGHQVEWLCSYCMNAYSDQTSITTSMAAMFNVLEAKILKAIK